MKIQNSKTPGQGKVTPRMFNAHNIGVDKRFSFKRTITQLSEQQFIERVTDLREGIDRQAERLANRMDIKDLEKYRQLVREFLDEIVSNGYTFSRESAYASRGKHRFIATVKTINQKLDEMGKEFLKEQADEIEILGKIDDIRGLLLDLMM